MGRVSKHKKIKSCDPFYKGPKRDLSTKDNLPPSNDDDQPVPKSLVRLMRASQKIVASETTRRKTTHDQTTGAKPSKKKNSIGRDVGILQNASSKEKSKKELLAMPVSVASEGSTKLKRQRRGVPQDWSISKDPAFQRMVGETLKSYLERIDVESNRRIMEAFKTEKKKSEKRKKYWEERKKKTKSRRSKDGGSMEFDDLKDEVHFGEVVSAPPRLDARPRGSAKKSKQEKNNSLALQKILRQTSDSRATNMEMQAKVPWSTRSRKPGDMEPRQGQPRVVGLKRKQDLEQERDRVIHEYRLTKKARINCKSQFYS